MKRDAVLGVLAHESVDDVVSDELKAPHDGAQLSQDTLPLVTKGCNLVQLAKAIQPRFSVHGEDHHGCCIVRQSQHFPEAISDYLITAIATLRRDAKNPALAEGSLA